MPPTTKTRKETEYVRARMQKAIEIYGLSSVARRMLRLSEDDAVRGYSLDSFVDRGADPQYAIEYYIKRSLLRTEGILVWWVRELWHRTIDAMPGHLAVDVAIGTVVEAPPGLVGNNSHDDSLPLSYRVLEAYIRRDDDAMLELCSQITWMEQED